MYRENGEKERSAAGWACIYYITSKRNSCLFGNFPIIQHIATFHKRNYFRPSTSWHSRADCEIPHRSCDDTTIGNCAATILDYRYSNWTGVKVYIGQFSEGKRKTLHIQQHIVSMVKQHISALSYILYKSILYMRCCLACCCHIRHDRPRWSHFSLYYYIPSIGSYSLV